MNLGENIRKLRLEKGLRNKEQVGEWGARTDYRNVCENLQRA